MDVDAGEHAGEDGAVYGLDSAGAKGGRSFVGPCITMLMGCILFPGALVLLGWNEKNTVCQDHILMNAEDNAVVGDCSDSSAVEGKFAFWSCPINEENMEKMTPSTSFNLPGIKEGVSFSSVAGAQKIEMYQCIETKSEEKVNKTVGASALETRRHVSKKTNGASMLQTDKVQREDVIRTEVRDDPTKETVYRYNMAWAESYYDSHKFKATPQNIAQSGCSDFIYKGQVNHNPALPDGGDGKNLTLGTQQIWESNIQAGEFSFGDPTEIKKLTATEPVPLLPFKDSFGLSSSTDNIVKTIRKDTLAVHSATPNYLSTCKTDRLGCIRISYNKSATKHISVLGYIGSSGVSSTQPIEARWGCPAVSFIKMYPEEMTKADMLAKMKGEKTLQTWVLRVAGLVCAWWALYCCMDPIASAVDVMGDVLSYIPVVGGMVESALEGVVEMFLCLASCGFGLSCGLLVIAVVWCGMRPIVGLPLLGGVLLLFVVGSVAISKAQRDPKKMRKGKMAQQQAIDPQRMMYA